MKTLKKIGASAAIILPLIMLLVMPMIVGAQNPNPDNPNPDLVESPINDIEDVENIVQRIVGWAQTFLFALAALFIIVAGYQYLTAAGSEDKVENAKNNLIYALVAIVLGLVAGGVVSFINQFLQG